MAAVDEDPGSGGFAAVDVDPPLAGELGTQHHRRARRPPTPVAGRERVEVGGERHLGLGSDLQRRAVGRMRAPGIGGRLLQVKLAYVERLARARQDDARQQTHRLTGLLGRGTVYIVDRGLTHPRVLPLLFSSSDAPSRRCGARTLSYIFN